jgi:hypothetical protein
LDQDERAETGVFSDGDEVPALHISEFSGQSSSEVRRKNYSSA